MEKNMVKGIYLLDSFIQKLNYSLDKKRVCLALCHFSFVTTKRFNFFGCAN